MFNHLNQTEMCSSSEISVLEVFTQKFTQTSLLIGIRLFLGSVKDEKTLFNMKNTIENKS